MHGRREGSCEGYVRDEVRDESFETPLNKGLLLKNVRDDEKISFFSYASRLKWLRLQV